MDNPAASDKRGAGLSASPRMNVKVQVRHFLVCARPSGVPDAQAGSRKGCTDGTCDASDHNEDGGGRLIVRTANIADVRPRNDEDMSWMELSQVKKRNGKRPEPNVRRRVFSTTRHCTSPDSESRLPNASRSGCPSRPWLELQRRRGLATGRNKP